MIMKTLQTNIDGSSKFIKIRKKPPLIYKKIYINKSNAEIGRNNKNNIIIEYQPGYLYGNAKMNKYGLPLRTIIFQIPTSFYQV